MEKDRRYAAVKVLIEAGHFKTFREIFEILPKTILAHDMGWKTEKISRLLDDITGITLDELYRIADLIGVEGRDISALAMAQREEDKKSPR